jgi:uncharacterized peroxidase-related enzyme
VVHHSAALAAEGGDAALTEAVVSADHQKLPGRLRALCDYALKLTLTPHQMQAADVDALRDEGLSDRDVVDANQVVAYFNYVNRTADGLGVELEEHWPEAVRKPRHYRRQRPHDDGEGASR